MNCQNELLQTLDITPYTEYLFAARRTQLGWKNFMAEVIDNSFDAKASAVAIDFGRGCKTLSITDDGSDGGEDLGAFFRLGTHQRHAGTKLGMYGVGLKDAALWLWGTTQVTTLRKGVVRNARVDWEDIRKSGRWEIGATETEATPERIASYGLLLPHGSTIRFSRIEKRLGDIDGLIEQIGYVFCPAIKSGRQIVFRIQGKKHLVPAFEPPRLESALETTSDVAGKTCKIRAGVVVEGEPNTRPGFTIAYRHRVILNTSEGCGKYGSARFFGWVDLDDDWKLSRHKDELVEDAGLLAEILFATCESQLRGAAQQARTIDLSGIEAKAASLLQGALKTQSTNVKARRPGRAGKTGTVAPKGTANEHRRASVLQPGDRKLLKSVGGTINLQLVNSGDRIIGRAEILKDGPLVSLSLDHPAVAWAAAIEDERPLTLLAASVLAVETSALTDKKQLQKYLPGIEEEAMRERFLHAFALYSHSIASEDAEAPK